MSNVKNRLLAQFALTPKMKTHDDLEGEIWIRQLSSAETEKYQIGLIDLKTGKVDNSKLVGQKAELIFLCVCEEDGTRVFANPKEADQGPSRVINALNELCLEVNGMDKNDEEKNLAGK